MTTFLLYDDSLRSPEMRHEISELVLDPVVFIDHDGKRILVASRTDRHLAERDDVVDEFWVDADLGCDELVKDQTWPLSLLGPELVARSLARLKAESVVVPPSFQVHVADYLRDKGIQVEVDPEAWALRRRRKSPSEIEGIERAQRAADTAMLTAGRMLRDAEPTAMGTLRFEGEILTAELIREAMTAELLSQGADGDEILVQSGEAAMGGHTIGSGPIRPDEPVIIDCFPRDRRTGAYTDMTRTFVCGTPSDDVRALHAHCRKALDIAFSSVRAGTADLFQQVSAYFESQGFPTIASHSGPAPLEEGFVHSLGHGVGLQVHERPSLGRRSEPLLAGDVIAVEPGLYFKGIGGVRLEDTVVVTEDGFEHLTDPYPYDLQP